MSNKPLTHSSEPRPLQSSNSASATASRPKYRDISINGLLHDPRISRGSTVGRPVLASTSSHNPLASSASLAGLNNTLPGASSSSSSSSPLSSSQQQSQRFSSSPLSSSQTLGGADQNQLNKSATSKRNSLPRKNENDSLIALLKNTQVVKAKKSVPIHLYLEEQVTPTEQTTVDTQTDEFLEQPPPKPFVPPKRGIDVRIQVDHALVFNFDRDVVPIVDMIVSKTLEQALVEVNEEVQLKALSLHKATLHRKQAEENQRIRQMEIEELRKAQQKKKEEDALRAQRKREAVVAEKIKSLAAARSYLSDLQNDVFDRLRATSFFVDPVHHEIENVFMPWLFNNVDSQMQRVQQTRSLVDKLLDATVDLFVQKQREDAERIPYRLFIHWDQHKRSSEPIGPLEIPHDANIGDVHRQLIAFLIDPTLKRPDLSELIDTALYEADPVKYEAAHKPADSEAAAEADAPAENAEAPAADGENPESGESVIKAKPAPPPRRRIKFYVGPSEVDGVITLKTLASDGRLAQLEMRVEV